MNTPTPVLEKNYMQMIGQDQRLARIFPKPPRPAFKRGKNIKELLCRARLPPDVKSRNTRGGGLEARNGLKSRDSFGNGMTRVTTWEGVEVATVQIANQILPYCHSLLELFSTFHRGSTIK